MKDDGPGGAALGEAGSPDGEPIGVAGAWDGGADEVAVFDASVDALHAVMSRTQATVATR